MRQINVAILIVLVVFSSSCASILNSKYQKVTVVTGSDNSFLVNGEEPKMKKGKVLLKRDKEPKQFTITREGYKDENIITMQYKRSPLYILSVVPFGIAFYPMFFDVGPKAYNYDKVINLSKELSELSSKNTEEKEIRLNNVSVDLDGEDFKYRYISSYKYYIRKEEKQKLKSSEDAEKIEFENTIFSGFLNNILKEKGYIDTANKVLKNSYLNNLLIDATIDEFSVHQIGYSKGFVYVELEVKWEALDYYKKSIYSQVTHSTSGQFAIESSDSRSDALDLAIQDAIEFGLMDFMNSDEVSKLLRDKSVKKEEDSFKVIKLNKGAKTVASLGDAIKSSVTIKTKNGHGSGFVISKDGHIVTNYHVVSEEEGLKVVMNDDTEYDVEIIRVSKIYDLALIKINAKNLMPFDISKSKDIEIAMDVYAVGTPSAEDLSQTISKGIISGSRKIDGDSKLIQTDASINGGNSGGALVTKEGLVVGVVSSKLKGFGIEGVAFGIPSYEIFSRLKISYN